MLYMVRILRVSDETYRELSALKERLEREIAESVEVGTVQVSYDAVIRYLLRRASEEGGKRRKWL